MIRFTKQHAALVAAIGSASLLAGCGEKAPPARVLPPPPPVAVVIPPKPTPPNGASPTLMMPPVDASGLRYSVNRNITRAQTLWNLRSAYNVAALNCHEPRHAEILVNYRTFLKTHEKPLANANKAVDAEFRAKHGSRFIAPREKYMTEVYNHFALPPTMGDFCSAVLTASREAKLIKPAELEPFAVRALPTIEVVFEQFYSKYAKYRSDLADWQARYAPLAGQSVAPGVSGLTTTASAGSSTPAS